MPRDTVRRGATIARLRAETGAEIQVGKQDDYITLTGGKSHDFETHYK
jgi:hypothetical protein